MPTYRLPAHLERGAILAMGAAIVLVAGVGTADAYWTARGVGTGTGTTGTISLTASVTAASGLYPGATVPVTVTLKNTSAAGNLTITSLSQSGAATIKTAGKGSCDPSVVSFAVGTLPSGTLTPNQAAAATGTVTMTTAAADGCQGTTFSVPLIANGKLG